MMLDYSKVPVYIMHEDGNDTDGVFRAISGEEVMTIALTPTGVFINGVMFYNKASIDQMLAEIEARVNTRMDNLDSTNRTFTAESINVADTANRTFTTSAISTADTATRSWVSANYVHV